ncbi:RidA family protein (plasmid) [Cupriavidus necator]|uniref:RidA family protein n=1 Tax=Cupriavidus necator TaxID=106590 RepID=A0A367P8F4_CUPNE|nr:RidA family protein [Cupriavidus necator]QQX89157.1 RidA family protein [Cupriavidus necator]RCJ04128.1 RidA family protein [Cupriavidus necator]
MTTQHLNPTGLLSFPPLTQVVVSSCRILAFIAGQTACNAQFEVMGGNDYRLQSIQALKNLQTAVHAAGATVRDIVSSTVYLRELTPEVAEQFMAAFSVAMDGESFPAHAFTMVGVQALASPDVLVEISAMVAFDA